MFSKAHGSAPREPAAALLIAGSYEKAICGWELGKKRSVTPVFQHLAHLGPVKAVASQGKYAVSGGNDEEIRIYNVRKRREVGSLMKHQAPITALRFSKKANSLVSGSDDGMIAVWRIKDWECVSFKPAHKGSVIDLDVHSSGKAMISCGRDSTLRLWDLSSTKELHCRTLKARGYGGFQHLRWRPRGEGFCYALGQDVAVCDTDADEPIVRFSHPRPPFSFAFLSDTAVATGGEDKIVRVWDVRTGKVSAELPEFTSRIRAVVAEHRSKALMIFGSNGDIAMYKTDALSHAAKCFWQDKTNMRITCACTGSAHGGDQDVNEDESGEDEPLSVGGRSGGSDGKQAATDARQHGRAPRKVYEQESGGEEQAATDDEDEDVGVEEDMDGEEDEDLDNGSSEEGENSDDAGVEEDSDSIVDNDSEAGQEDSDGDDASEEEVLSESGDEAVAGSGSNGDGDLREDVRQQRKKTKNKTSGPPRERGEMARKSDHVIAGKQEKKSPYRVFSSLDDVIGAGDVQRGQTGESKVGKKRERK